MVPDYELIGRLIVNMLPWLIGYTAGWMSSAMDADFDFDNSVFAVYAIVVGIITFFIIK